LQESELSYEFKKLIMSISTQGASAKYHSINKESLLSLNIILEGRLMVSPEAAHSDTR